MANSVDPGRATVYRRAGTLLLAMLAFGFVGAILAGTSARANPGTLSQTAPTHCTPPTNPYNTSTTVATCGTTTTVGQATITLSASYRSGHLKWRECAGQPASGSAVELWLGRQGGGSAQPVDSSQIGSSGCTPDSNLAICLASDSYTATGVVQGYGQASQSFTVQKSGCQNPTTLTASAGQTGSGAGHDGSVSAGTHRGFLAFTGANVAVMAIGALALLALGYALVKLSRQRRHSA